MQYISFHHSIYYICHAIYVREILRRFEDALRL